MLTGCEFLIEKKNPDVCALPHSTSLPTASPTLSISRCGLTFLILLLLWGCSDDALATQNSCSPWEEVKMERRKEKLLDLKVEFHDPSGNRSNIGVYFINLLHSEIKTTLASDCNLVGQKSQKMDPYQARAVLCHNELNPNNGRCFQANSFKIRLTGKTYKRGRIHLNVTMRRIIADPALGILLRE